ncbi:FtsX-like permease family protein [Streptomyces sp. NPDC049954]|uniref:FtsX-like permease family protein n=1 Tax=Streptomyces sp. NPDC049954 TaxID=3155779 RepID=UPI00342A3F0E
MSALDERPVAAPASPPPGRPPKGVAMWARDLAMGVRLAVAGGREGWIRAALTALGVGLGVLLLLTASCVPTLNARQSDRWQSRTPQYTEAAAAAHDPRAFRVGDGSSEFRDRTIGGYVVRKVGRDAPAPRGTDRFPGPGEMFVSPALHELLADKGNASLRKRFAPYKEAGTIGPSGLEQPHELFVYLDPGARADAPYRNTLLYAHAWAKNKAQESDPLDPVLLALIIMICVVLLTPVLIFIGTAVRFGGEGRDRRLAALRLIGADIATTRRTAAGEALFGSLLGLVLGGGLFLGARQVAPHFSVSRFSAYPGDLTPVVWIAVLVCLAVPVSAVVVTLLSLRAVAIEPLGVVRDAVPRGRRLWWRLVIAVLGIAVLLSDQRLRSTPEERADQAIDPYRLGGGAALTLLGLALLLPWLVEYVVRTARGGPVPWQLAVRRLQLSSGTAARAVSGITVAVAGAVALQMLLLATNADFQKVTGEDVGRAGMGAYSQVADVDLSRRLTSDLSRLPAVEKVMSSVTGSAHRPGADMNADRIQTVFLTIGDCATLKEMARIGRCAEGDAFRVFMPDDKEYDKDTRALSRPGQRLDLDSGGEHPRLWTVPGHLTDTVARKDPGGDLTGGLYLTPSAINTKVLDAGSGTTTTIQLDDSVPGAADLVRDAVFQVDPTMRVWAFSTTEQDSVYTSVRHGLQVGAVVTMIMIAASLFVTMIEQLRERRRLLAALTAFGTRRSSLAWSLLWQTAIPMTLGLALATVGGLGLGAALVRLLGKEVTGWFVFLPMVGVGAALILSVTLLSLPVLWRMMRADGLRTE